MGGETCVDGVCTMSVPPPGECDPACADGETCENGMCVSSTPPGECDPACADGESCENGMCVSSTPPDDLCEEGQTSEECAAALCADAEDLCACYEALSPGYCDTTPIADHDCVCPDVGTDETCQQLTECALANGLTPSDCDTCYGEDGMPIGGVNIDTETATCNAANLNWTDMGSDDGGGDDGGGDDSGNPPGFAPGDPVLVCEGMEITESQSVYIELALEAELPWFSVGGSVKFEGKETKTSAAAYCVEGDNSPTIKVDGKCVANDNVKLKCSRKCSVCATQTAKGNVKISYYVASAEGGTEVEGTQCGYGSIEATFDVTPGTPGGNKKGQCNTEMNALTNGTWTSLCDDAEQEFEDLNNARYVENCGNKANGDAWCEANQDWLFKNTFGDHATNSRCKLINTGNGEVENNFGECKLYSLKHRTCPGAGSNNIFAYPCDKGLACVLHPDSSVNCGLGLFQSPCKYYCIEDGSGTYEGKL